MKPVSRIRKCVGHLSLAIMLLVAADRHYPAVLDALGVGTEVVADRNAGMDIVAAARSQIGVTVKYAPAYEAIEYPNGDVPRARGVCNRNASTDVPPTVTSEDIACGWQLREVRTRVHPPRRLNAVE